MDSAHIKRFRQNYGLTQSELGDLVGRSRSTIASWEGGGPVDAAASRLLRAIDGRSPQEIRRMMPVEPHPDTAFDVFRSVLDAVTDHQEVKASVPISALLELSRADSAGSGLNASVGAAGGFLVNDRAVGPVVLPPPSSPNLSQLGARYVPVDQEWNLGDHIRPVFIDLPQPYWLGDGKAAGDSTPTMAAFHADMKTVGCKVGASHTLMTLGGDRLESALSRAIVTSLMRALDAAALAGDGLMQPLGVVNAAARTNGIIGVIDWVDTERKLDQASAQSLGVVADPLAKSYFATIKRTPADAFTLWRAESGVDWCGGRRALASAAMPERTLVVGDFTSIEIHHSSTVELRANRNNASGATILYAFVDAQVVIPCPELFQVLKLDE